MPSQTVQVLGWCKSNCSFALLNSAVRYWNTFLNKCGNAIHHFNVHFSLYVFASDLLLIVYFLFILDYGNEARQKANMSSFLI